jgi:cell division septal protein FtsQ
VRLIARCLGDLQSRADLRSRVSQLDVSDARDVVALLTDDGARLHLGDTGFADRLTMYLQIAPTLREQLHDLDYVDLRFGDRVFVRAGAKTKTVEGKKK